MVGVGGLDIVWDGDCAAVVVAVGVAIAKVTVGVTVAAGVLLTAGELVDAAVAAAV